ncbi:concanavalin A-like lectin/glucanase domain-containing protein [Tuber borchii]|uniref:Protein SSH4 n=1 Tax=Tuber borchii TaxID=42251 RepID=A0A2T7A7G6_TUBBO|nr:concanavalin A-like lectin/glucanase domain-containing protein [Tuber borchii]
MAALSDPKTASAAGQGLLIGLLSAFGSAGLVGIVIIIIYFFRNTSRGRIWLDRIGRPGEYDDEQALAREEAEALEQMDEISRQEYLRAKAFIEANPPDSVPTDISLSQFLAIQEKGVSAWEFEAELEIANCFVEARTEIEFYDSVCSVQSNLPVPKQNEVYYWEAKLYEKPENTLLSIGMSTKPYPMFRLPGWHKHSIAYTSSGQRRHNQPFHGTPYAPSYHQGDVIGVGYRPRTGTIFFTRNGKKLEDVAHGLKSLNLFPTVGANGPCTVHVNFGQLGFVFIEANVKKWGLAPTTGSLAPPPPYGSEQGSILLETGQRGQSPSRYFESQAPPQHGRGRSGSTLRTGLANSGRAGSSAVSPTSPGPERSPTDISLANINVYPSTHTGGGNIVRQNSPPPDYTSQSSMGSSSSEDDDDSDEGSRRRSERGVERERLLRRSPTPAYRDVVSEFPSWAAGGRSRSGSAPAGPSGSGRRF